MAWSSLVRHVGNAVGIVSGNDSRWRGGDRAEARRWRCPCRGRRQENGPTSIAYAAATAAAAPCRRVRVVSAALLALSALVAEAFHESTGLGGNVVRKNK